MGISGSPDIFQEKMSSLMASLSRVHSHIFGWHTNYYKFIIYGSFDEIQEGDILVFHNAGAYCSSMASNYNSRFKPAEVMIYEGKDYLIRERDKMEDLTAKQIEVNFENGIEKVW